jgi:glycosyltransferase involved in cell wall biosynthesis
MLVDAMAKLARPSMLLVTGDGPERPALQEQARRLGLSDRVKFLGFVDRDRLRRLTSAVTAAVLPTRALEGFGLSAAEAFASGTPVIATPVAALVDTVGGMDQRLMAPAASADGLLSVMERLLSSPELTGEEFRRQCRNYALARFDWQALKHDFVKLAVDTLSDPLPGAEHEETMATEAAAAWDDVL